MERKVELQWWKACWGTILLAKAPRRVIEVRYGDSESLPIQAMRYYWEFLFDLFRSHRSVHLIRDTITNVCSWLIWWLKIRWQKIPREFGQGRRDLQAGMKPNRNGLCKCSSSPRWNWAAFVVSRAMPPSTCVTEIVLDWDVCLRGELIFYQSNLREGYRWRHSRRLWTNRWCKYTSGSTATYATHGE